MNSVDLFSVSEPPALSVISTSREVDESPFSCDEPSSAAFFAAASCLALSSSIETRSASASSGSIFGSTPNSKPAPPAEAAAVEAWNLLACQ